MSNLTNPSYRRNTHFKPPDRHRRTYEAAGQLWPEDLTKHLQLAEWSDAEYDAYLTARKTRRVA